jgi:hypothetical protein
LGTISVCGSAAGNIRAGAFSSNAPVPRCEALAEFLKEWRQQTPYNSDADYIFASTKLNGRQPLWGQTLNADFVKPAAVSLGLVAEGERFGWHRFRHSLSTWANETTKDITVSQTLLRYSKPDTTAIYTHGAFGKALNAQRQYMAELMSKIWQRGLHQNRVLRISVLNLNHDRVARSPSVEAFHLRAPQARLPPAKGGAGFGEGVLQSRTPTDHGLLPRTSSP